MAASPEEPVRSAPSGLIATRSRAFPVSRPEAPSSPSCHDAGAFVTSILSRVNPRSKRGTGPEKSSVPPAAIVPSSERPERPSRRTRPSSTTIRPVVPSATIPRLGSLVEAPRKVSSVRTWTGFGAPSERSIATRTSIGPVGSTFCQTSGGTNGTRAVRSGLLANPGPDASRAEPCLKAWANRPRTVQWPQVGSSLSSSRSSISSSPESRPETPFTVIGGRPSWSIVTSPPSITTSGTGPGAAGPPSKGPLVSRSPFLSKRSTSFGPRTSIFPGANRPRRRPPIERSVPTCSAISQAGESSPGPSRRVRPERPAEEAPSHQPSNFAGPCSLARSCPAITAGTTQARRTKTTTKTTAKAMAPRSAQRAAGFMPGILRGKGIGRTGMRSAGPMLYTTPSRPPPPAFNVPPVSPRCRSREPQAPGPSTTAR